MANIGTRLTKLEQNAHDKVDHRSKDERDAAYADFVEKIRPIALVCNSPDDLAAYLKSVEATTSERVVSLQARQCEDAVRAAMARSIWDQTRQDTLTA